MFLTIDLTKEAEQCAKIYWDGAYAGCKIITLGFSSLGFAQGKEINLCPHFNCFSFSNSTLQKTKISPQNTVKLKKKFFSVYVVVCKYKTQGPVQYPSS